MSTKKELNELAIHHIGIVTKNIDLFLMNYPISNHSNIIEDPNQKALITFVGIVLNIKGGGGSGSGECSNGGIGKGCLLPIHNASGGKQNKSDANNKRIKGKGANVSV